MHFLKRKISWCLTFYGWLAIVLGMFAVLIITAKMIHPFLALNRPLEGGLAVVEGWSPDYVMQQAIAEFKEHEYRLLLTTGGPLNRGFHLSTYKTFAEIGAATIRKLGFDPDLVIAIPGPEVKKDRTFASALALKKWLQQRKEPTTALTVYTLDTHARRTKLLFEKALGAGFQVGVVTVNNLDYDADHWWQSSIGMRSILNEVIAYIYTRLFFYPAADRL